jgi:FkbM family methyltransferase
MVSRSARRVQRVLRYVDPALAARLTWIWHRRVERELTDVVERFVHVGDVVLDIGASWGLYTARFARLVGSSGRVHAFEPHPANGPLLRRLARRYSSITVHELAVSEQPGTAELHVPLFKRRAVTALSTLSPTASSRSGAEERLPVRVASLDELLPPDVPISFVKCDVEGHELSVLRGGESILRRFRPALLLEVEQRHHETSIDGIFEYVEGLGYRGWCVGPQGLRPLVEFDLERDQLRFLRSEFAPFGMPDGYVGNFLFASADDTPVLPGAVTSTSS